MSVRRQTANRLTLFRTCGTCGKQIVTTADTPWVRQVERENQFDWSHTIKDTRIKEILIHHV